MMNCLGVMPFCLFIVFELSCIQIMWKHVVCFHSLKLKLVSEFSLSSDIPRTKGLKKNRNENKNHFVTLASIILNRHPFVFWKYIHVYLRFQSYMYFMGRNTKFVISYKTTIRPYCQYSSFLKLGWDVLILCLTHLQAIANIRVLFTVSMTTSCYFEVFIDIHKYTCNEYL